MRISGLNTLYFIFVIALVINVGFWLQSRKVQLEWDNVPAAMNSDYAGLIGIGDDQIAYRMIGYFLQNLGNAGGRFEPLKNYNYEELENWFFVGKLLDDKSAYIPFLAAYYYGALSEKDPDLIEHVVNYLEQAGQSTYGEQWRWLAQAVYLTRFILKDRERALGMADKLSVMEADVAPWGRQLSSFINLEMGNREAAFEIMIRILKTEGAKLDPVEVIYIQDYICNRALDAAEAAKLPLCQTNLKKP
jgi:hypothetical protein